MVARTASVPRAEDCEEGLLGSVFAPVPAPQAQSRCSVTAAALALLVLTAFVLAASAGRGQRADPVAQHDDAAMKDRKPDTLKELAIRTRSTNALTQGYSPDHPLFPPLLRTQPSEVPTEYSLHGAQFVKYMVTEGDAVEAGDPVAQVVSSHRPVFINATSSGIVKRIQTGLKMQMFLDNVMEDRNLATIEKRDRGRPWWTVLLVALLTFCCSTVLAYLAAVWRSVQASAAASAVRADKPEPEPPALTPEPKPPAPEDGAAGRQGTPAAPISAEALEWLRVLSLAMRTW